MKKKENILGTENIFKLIRHFSIPCIISMLVNSLYNMVDQIFIGQSVGMLGNGATNVVFPLSIIALAFSLMIGDGASAYLSLKLGENKKDSASLGVGNGIILSVLFSIFFTILTLVFLPFLLNLFGCTDSLREYAMDYGKIIALGLPFVMIGTTLNSIIRADGSPKFSMLSMVSGAILNIILDPVFLFWFHMGVEGAALATIISQFVTFIFNVWYICKFKSIHLDREKIKLKFSVVKKVLALGISSFITQMSFVVVISVQNNLLGYYGALSDFGSEIPITVLGIVMKMSQILYSIVLGIAIGAQPIFGYNYGAKKYDRVKEALKIVLGSSLIITLIAFLLFQTIPNKLILIFGNGDGNYIKFACLTFRIYLMLVICNGIQIPAGIFFQAIGKSSKSAILSLSRQVLFLIPAMFLLSHMFGLMGILYAGPVADSLAFLLAVCLLYSELRFLSKVTRKVSQKANENVLSASLTKRVIITIGREYGSGGRYVGQLLAERLQIPCYDKEFVKKVAKETGLSNEFILENEQKRNVFDAFSNGYYGNLSNADSLFLKESLIIKDLAKKGSCVIVGRCADFVLKEDLDLISIFLYSDMDNKIKRATSYYGIDEKKAFKEISKINKLRANHYKHYTDMEWSDVHHYDICMNTDILGVSKTADYLFEFIQKR